MMSSCENERMKGCHIMEEEGRHEDAYIHQDRQTDIHTPSPHHLPLK